jgi:hypothetical protein
VEAAGRGGCGTLLAILWKINFHCSRLIFKKCGSSVEAVEGGFDFRFLGGILVGEAWNFTIATWCFPSFRGT